MPYRLECELVPQTPVFNAGAARTLPELLRVPSLKGALLWWFRAMLGAVCTLDGLRTLAVLWFGGPTQAGDLRVDLSGPLPKGEYPLKPFDKQEARWSLLDGFRYLAYGLEGRPFYDPADRPSLQLRLRCTRQDTWEATWCCLWLLSRLGGLGARTRRGMGGFWLCPEGGAQPPKGLPALEPQVWATAAEVADSLKDGLNQVAACLARHAGVCPLRFALHTAPTASTSPVVGGKPGFSCFAPGFWRGRIVQLEAGDWESALNALGKMYQGWRHPPAPGTGRPFSKDFGVAAGYAGSGRAAGSRLAAFGLPLLLSFRSGKHAGARVGVRETGRLGDEDSRRASPMWLRVLRSNNGKFFGFVHVFKSKFVTDSEDRLEFYMKAAPATGNRQPASAPFAVNWTEVDAFLDSLTGPEVYVC